MAITNKTGTNKEGTNKPTSPDGTPPPVDSPWRSLRERNFRLFMIGGFISNTGRWFQGVAIPAVIWELTESAAWVGFAGFSRMAPMAVVSPLAGALADRYDRRRLLFVTQSMQAAATGLLMLMWIVGIRSPEAFIGVSALGGLCSGLNLPGWKAFISDLVPRGRLLNAITLNSMQFNASRMFGPALAGIALAAFGPAWAFFVNFASFGAVLLALALIDVDTGPAEGEREPFAPMRDFVRTIGWIRTHPGITQAIVTVGVVGFLGLPVQVLAVVFAEDVFDRDATAYGFMLTMIGLGAVLVGPLVAGRGSAIARSRLEGFALIVYALSILGFALSPTLPAALFCLVGLGAAHLTSASVLNTTVQVQVPEVRRAKVLSVYMMIVTLSSPLGQLVLGQVMASTGPRPTMVGAGLALLIFAIVFIATGRLGRLDSEGQSLRDG